MKRRHEQAVIDTFSRFMERKALDLGRLVTRCALDGQDSIFGADYIFTNHTNFLMVEFKYEKSDIKHEGHKRRRLMLCQTLDVEDDWRDFSLQCHYVA